MRRSLWVAGRPVRLLLLGLIRIYRVTLGQLLGGGCRFYPTCSAYAEGAIRNTGAIQGVFLSVWRVLRCSPLSKGGVDHPPKRSRWSSAYVDDTQVPPSDVYENVTYHPGAWSAGGTA
jgi:putative membrane protein insertion efficiency factor